jgi:AcrR family transcriptional regulator
VTRIDKRQHIMQVAERLFTTRRIHEITTDDVAAAAAVGKGTIYRYFQDKDDLFFQIITNGFDELCDLLQRRVPGDAPFEDQLIGATREISRFFASRRQLLRMMQAEEGRLSDLRGDMRDRWLAKRKKLLTAVTVIMAKGVADGHLRGDVPAEVLATMLLGMLRARSHDLADAPTAHQRNELVVELFCNGARPSKH